MAKATIQDILTTQTFQSWFDKTNEIVGLMREEVVTASTGGDSTIGNVTLVGDFNSSNMSTSGTLQTNTITNFTGGNSIVFNSSVQLEGTSDICATFNFGSTGGLTRYSSDTFSWDIGLQGTSFIINTGVGDNVFELSSAGTLTIPDLVVSGSISGAGFVSDSIAEGNTNLFYTDSRVSSAISSTVNKVFVDALNINADRLNGVNSTLFMRNDSTQSLNGSLTVNGNVNVSGNVTTDYSASDINLKENLVKIDDSLCKVSILSGYTFNYINRPNERVAGLVAQEVERVLPEAVYEFENSEGEVYKAVRYGNIVSLLVEAIKELSEKVERLENK
jgi:hypothetical protein